MQNSSAHCGILGADPNSIDKAKWRPLHVASYYGLNKSVELLLSKNVDINSQNDIENTPVLLAAFNGKYDAAQLLIEQGADISLKNKYGKGPIDVATDNNYTNIVEILEAADRHRNIRKACREYSELPTRNIYGGSPAESGEFPWMVALGYIKLNSNYRISFECGGTIISERFVLTAAHCTKLSHPPIFLRMGKLTLNDPGAIDHQIMDIIRHPNYSKATVANDIALVRVIKEIVFTFDTIPACLRTTLRDERPETKLTVTGWGLTENRRKSNELLNTELVTVPLSECNRTYVDYNRQANHVVYQNGLRDSQYCAHDPHGRRDSCSGDSGGPLQIFQSGSHMAKVVGIISFGVGCGSLPSIYTRVAFYLDWIQSHVWPNDDIY